VTSLLFKCQFHGPFNTIVDDNGNGIVITAGGKYDVSNFMWRDYVKDRYKIVIKSGRWELLLNGKTIGWRKVK
jgi:hypothetical protein